MAGVGVDTKIHPERHLDKSAFSPEEGGASMSTQSANRNTKDFYQVQQSLTLDEVRYSEMRKKIPGMGRVPKVRKQQHGEENTEWDKRKRDHIFYVKQHFHQIECCRFVPKKGQDVKRIQDLKCYCGEILSEHAGLSNSPMNNVQRDILEAYLIPEPLRGIINRETQFRPVPFHLPEVEWTESSAFRTGGTTTFGKINFVNVETYGGSKPAKYIRLSHKDSMENLVELMDKHWKIMEPQPPSLCISVIGGAKSFKLDGKMRETFNTGLIRAAKTTNAWLITSGFNVGVMKAVGQAVSEGQSFVWQENRITHMLRCIGIGPWGYVKNRKYLESHDSNGNGRFPSNFKTSNVILHGQPVPLNPNHTHFVFVDNGKRNTYAGASQFRAMFEQKVSKPTEENGLGIPVVLVILEGGTDAISDAKTSLEHKIPVVVCAGTGRAADILAYAYSHTKKNKGEIKPKYVEKLKEKIYDSYGERWKDEEIDKNIESNLSNVMECMKHRELISIFNMNKHEELDIAILSALLKSKAAQRNEEIRLSQLKLALTWNRSDIAQEEIFREDVLWPMGSLDGVMMEAILEDRVEFVQLILQQNVVMKEFLTKSRLEELYKEALKRPECMHLQKLLIRITGSGDFSFARLDKLLDLYMDKFDETLLDVDTEELKQYGPNEMIMANDANQNWYKFPYKQLLVWSLLTMKMKIAMLSWEMGSEPVTSAIAATRILGSMSVNIHRNEIALRQKIEEQKGIFEKLAKNVLDSCHMVHHDKAMMLAERKSPTWSKMTSMEMAASAADMVYLSSVACQNSIDSTWRRGVKSRWPKVLMAMLFPPLILSRFIETNSFGEDKPSMFQKLLTFYTAPITKFAHHALAYVVFVILFTYFILVDFRRGETTTVEAVCIGWILSFMIDELYTLLTFPSPTFKGKMRDWYGLLKILSSFNFALAVFAFVVHVSGGRKYSEEAKVIYCVNGILFYVRCLSLYTTNSSLGPKLVMIKKMIDELRMFLLVLVVFLLAYGVAAQALMFTEREPSWQILKDVIYYPYWQLYGELFFEEIETQGDEACNATAMALQGFDCRTFHWLVPILLAGYLIIGNVLLFNLLIAIFNHVFTTVEENSIEIWKFQMYFLVMEFDNKTTLVPPLSLISHFYLMIKWIFRKTCCRKKVKGVQFTERHLEFLQLFEKEEMSNYLRTQKYSIKETVESKLQKRVDELFKLVEEELLADHTTSFLDNIGNIQDKQLIQEDTCPLDINGWPTTSALLKIGKEEEEKKEKEEVMEDAEASHKEKKKKKKHKKEKKKKKKEDEDKIINTDSLSETKPVTGYVKNIPNVEISESSVREQTSKLKEEGKSRDSSLDALFKKPPRSQFLQRRLTPDADKGSDSDDSEEDNKEVRSPKGLNMLSRPSRQSPQSDSDSDVPKRRRFFKKKGRDSSTEEEKGRRKWSKTKLRNLSDTE
ncbi:hypothetical protein FSP39_006870 [Pinctada imbricata]|uniref:Uncharacterized protein n=1 Tax=Pinctada imbricata TaxID=66713 RepID=A0AA88Y8D5_PINIB|nr:hypothetical protein FSP39_006870 [Pinctada imbricata]